MKKNMGILDRTLRAMLGIAFVLVFFLNVVNGVAGMILLIFGVILLLTSLLAYCPLYTPLNISTCRGQERIKN